MDIILAPIDEDQARLTLHYSGDRLQLNGYRWIAERPTAVRWSYRCRWPAAAGCRPRCWLQLRRCTGR
jgi:hypothetical protein